MKEKLLKKQSWDMIRLTNTNFETANLFGPIIEKIPEKEFETIISGIKLLNKEDAVKEP